MNRGLCFSRMCRPLAWVWGAWLLLDPTGAPSQDKAVEPPLFEAVRSGTMEDVQARIAAGADPIGRDEQGLSPLDWALKLGRHPIARALLPHQTRVHKADPLPLAIGMDIRIGGPLPAEGSAWVAAPCIAKVWRTVRFCVEAITWPETLVAALRVRSHLYQGAWAIVRYDQERATYAHALFPSISMESLVAWMRRRHGEPTSILQRRAQVFSKGRVDNPTIVWELPDPTTGEHRILEIRRFDDTRGGGFPDTRHGVILLHDQAAESVFPRLSSVEVMALRIADPRDGDTGQDSAAKNSPYPSLYPAKTASPSRKEANRGPRLPKTAPRPPPAPPPVLSGPNPFDPDTKTASPLPTIGPVEESR